jgi:serine/threonine protein kinase
LLLADIKPQNVLLTDALDVRLGDFNTALHLPSLTSVSGSSTLTDPIGLGTTSYSPLEFVRRSPSPFGLPADVFSTGVTLMVALVGREPFERIVGARGKTRADLMVWVGRGGYWAWEERERMSAGEDTMASAEDGQNGDSEEDEPSGVAPGPQQVETLLGKPCPAELRTTIVSSRSMRGCRKGIDETAQALDRHRYPDGSPALYYLGRGDDGRQVRVPDEAVMLLKRMCLPAAEERPLIDEAVAIFENVFKATCN